MELLFVWKIPLPMPGLDLEMAIDNTWVSLQSTTTFSTGVPIHWEPPDSIGNNLISLEIDTLSSMYICIKVISDHSFIMIFYHQDYPNEAASWCLASDKYLISRIIPCIINVYIWDICIGGMNMFNSIVIMFFHHQNYSNEAVPWWYLASDKYLISRIQSGLVDVSWFSSWVL